MIQRKLRGRLHNTQLSSNYYAWTNHKSTYNLLYVYVIQKKNSTLSIVNAFNLCMTMFHRLFKFCPQLNAPMYTIIIQMSFTQLIAPFQLNNNPFKHRMYAKMYNMVTKNYMFCNIKIYTCSEQNGLHYWGFSDLSK